MDEQNHDTVTWMYVGRKDRQAYKNQNNQLIAQGEMGGKMYIPVSYSKVLNSQHRLRYFEPPSLHPSQHPLKTHSCCPNSLQS